MVLLDGKALSSEIMAKLTAQIAKLSRPPVLKIIVVGDDPASLKYTQLKKAKSKMVGIDCQIISFPASVSEQELKQLITGFNQDQSVDALMVQLPLPPGFNTQSIVNTISPQKDADGLTGANLGKLFSKDPSAIVSATPLGIITLLSHHRVSLAGKHAVIIGRSPIVGLPLVALLEQGNATVTLCHSHTTDLSSFTQTADILISATGKSSLITGNMVKPGAVVVDVGSGYVDGKLAGDVDFTSVSPKCSYITPNPGGVGPMTVACLLQNVVKIASYENSTI